MRLSFIQTPADQHKDGCHRLKQCYCLLSFQNSFEVNVCLIFQFPKLIFLCDIQSADQEKVQLFTSTVFAIKRSQSVMVISHGNNVIVLKMDIRRLETNADHWTIDLLYFLTRQLQIASVPDRSNYCYQVSYQRLACLGFYHG